MSIRRGALAAALILLSSVRAHALVQDLGYASSVPATTGWNYEASAQGTPSGKSCSAGTTGAAQQPANYNPTVNTSYWLEGTATTGLVDRTADMHIVAVGVDAYGTNGSVTSGTISLYLGVNGTGITGAQVLRSWSGATKACDWFGTKSGSGNWDVTARISPLDLTTIRNMNVRVRRHSNSGTAGSDTYYDVLVSSLRTVVTWQFNAPDVPSRFGAVEHYPDGVSLGWDNQTTTPGRICAFEISRSTDGGAYQVIVPASCASPVLGASASDYMDANVVPGHTYTYQLRALGEGGYSGAISDDPVVYPGPIAWVNAAGGAWETPANWSLGRVPVEGDHAEITLAGTYTVTLGTSVAVAALTVGGSSGFQTLQVSNCTLSVSTCFGGGAVVNDHGAVIMLNSTPHTWCRRCNGMDICGSGTYPVTYTGNTVLQSSTCAADVINQGALTVRGACAFGGNLTNSAGATVNVEGALSTGSASLTVHKGLGNSGTINLRTTSPGAGALLSAAGISNAVGGRLASLSGSAATLELRATSTTSDFGGGFTNLGMIQADAPLTLTGFESNGGTMTLNAATTLANASTSIPSVTNTGTIVLSPAGPLTVAGSSLANSGTIAGAGQVQFASLPAGGGLANSGVLAPGAGSSQPGVLESQAPLTLSGSGALHVKLAGATAGAGYDQVVVDGAVVLGGELDVSLAGGYQAQPGLAYTCVRSQGRTGQFQTVNLPPGGAGFDVVYTDTGVELWPRPWAGVGGQGAPARFHLEPPVPQPSHGRVTVEFGLAASGSARLEIFDVAGRRVRRLAEGTLAAGTRTVTWDGRDAGGQSAGSGVFYLRLSGGGRTIDRKFVVVR